MTAHLPISDQVSFVLPVQSSWMYRTPATELTPFGSSFSAVCPSSFGSIVVMPKCLPSVCRLLSVFTRGSWGVCQRPTTPLPSWSTEQRTLYNVCTYECMLSDIYTLLPEKLRLLAISPLSVSMLVYHHFYNYNYQ